MRLGPIALSLVVAACGGGPAGPVVVVAPPPAAPAVPSPPDTGTRIAEGATLPDGAPAPRTKIHPGDAELVNDQWVLYRLTENDLRARPAKPSSLRLSRTPVALSIGDRAKAGDWDVQWIAVREGAPVLVARHHDKKIDEWQAVLPRPNREIASSTKLEHFEITLVSIKGDPHLEGATLTITGDAVERAASAKLGQSLKPGLYVFPDGLRMHVEQIANCDFDTSVPCFGGTYRAIAMKGPQEARVEWRTKTANVLGYTLTLAGGEFSVRK